MTSLDLWLNPPILRETALSVTFCDAVHVLLARMILMYPAENGNVYGNV